MNTINASNQNVNFTARMDLRGVTKNLERWQKVAKEFEAKTSKYPNDTFDITDFADSCEIYHYDKGVKHENGCSIGVEQLKNLFENTDDFVAKKMIKLFNIFKAKDAEYDSAEKYISSVIKKDKNGDPTDFEQKFWDIVVDKAEKDRDIAVSKDKVLSQFKVY